LERVELVKISLYISKFRDYSTLLASSQLKTYRFQRVVTRDTVLVIRDTVVVTWDKATVDTVVVTSDTVVVTRDTIVVTRDKAVGSYLRYSSS